MTQETRNQLLGSINVAMTSPRGDNHIIKMFRFIASTANEAWKGEAEPGMRLTDREYIDVILALNSGYAAILNDPR